MKKKVRKNNWNSTSARRKNALKHGYNSGFELDIANLLKEVNYSVNYETEVLKYTVPETHHKYTPDFVLTKHDGDLLYIETKGRWTTADRKKMKYVLKCNPGIDIRIIFQNSKQKISKNSKTTYEQYANKLGIKHVANKTIPAEWLAECCQIDEVPTKIRRKFF